MDSEKHCTLQDFEEQLPSHTWDLAKLSEYCRARDQRIARKEQLVTPLYWELGLALHLAREHFRHGQWTKFLQSLGIDPTRASRARAIYQNYSSVEELQGLSVHQALAKRQHKATRSKQANLHDASPFQVRLDHISHQLTCLSAEIDTLDRREAKKIWTTAAAIIGQLNAFRRSVRAHARRTRVAS